MTTTVHLFAAARELIGKSEVILDQPRTVLALRQELGERYPALVAILPNCRIAVNHEFAHDHDCIPPNAELAVIPPVSGG
jgi:MoaE-MoaD fusion protein